ncbi:MAG: hypothetical protein ABI869_02080, partial [Actinomycetota bacterium]
PGDVMVHRSTLDTSGYVRGFAPSDRQVVLLSHSPLASTDHVGLRMESGDGASDKWKQSGAVRHAQPREGRHHSGIGWPDV